MLLRNSKKLIYGFFLEAFKQKSVSESIFYVV